MKAYLACLLAVLVAYAPAVVWALPSQYFFRRSVAAPPAANPINNAVFGGSQYLRVSSSTPSGLSNSKAFTVSFWVKMNGGDGVGQFITYISYGAIARFFVARGSSNKIRVGAWNVGQTEILNLTGASDVVVSSGWTHVMVAVDLTSTANRALYINGVNEAATSTWTTYTNDFINFLDTGGTRITIGADKENTPGFFLNGALGELWFNDTYNNVIGDYYSAGKAVPVGATGQLPIGTSPVLYYSPGGSGNSWNSNGGTGGTLTRTGTLTTDADPPDWNE